MQPEEEGDPQAEDVAAVGVEEARMLLLLISLPRKSLKVKDRHWVSTKDNLKLLLLMPLRDRDPHLLKILLSLLLKLDPRLTQKYLGQLLYHLLASLLICLLEQASGDTAGHPET